jgi:putative zinc finger/helix-turn-helix YgiT family protein
MKSPFTGGATKLEKELRILEYRKDSFEVLYHYYVCVDSNEQFTTTEIDTLNLNQVYNKYREKYGIPFTDEIKNIREKYGLSAAKMSEVLGLGVNVYRNYEAGEMPSVATGRLIRLAEDANEFGKLLEMSRNSLEQHEYDKVKKKVDNARSGWGKMEEVWKGWLFGNDYPNIQNGYRVPTLEKIGNMVCFFAQRNKPYTTALNKLMFYADFGHFKKYGQSISGLCYKAIQKGPVPENYGGIYNHVVNKGFAKVEEMDFGEFVGERFVTDGTVIFDAIDGLFTDTELTVMENVSERFKGLSTKKIIEISHEEPAWQDNVDSYHRISFEYGFELKNID